VRFYAASAAILALAATPALPLPTEPPQKSQKHIIACKHKRPHRARCLHCPPCNKEWGRIHHWHPAPVSTAEISSGGWAIPPAIVECESGFTNEAARADTGAAGYYQIEPGTWSEWHGSPPDNASEHSKAEQGVVAKYGYEHEGTSPWHASESCWGGRV
jgi:hypothetical protein